MDFLNDKIKPMYLKYLSAAFGSALITSIYSVVDMAMVGQYQGPSGTAALAVVAPIWNIIYSLGLLMGIGGSVLFSTARGNKSNKTNENEFFTVSIIGSVILSIFFWIIIIVFEEQILTFFGADTSLLILAKKYMKPIKYVFPMFLFNQMLAAFIRNDKNPGLATFGVLSGGIFNIVGDYIFVFTCDLGIFGAGLATAIGSVISFVVMITHFFGKKNTLKLIKPNNTFKILLQISTTGFSTFFIDVAMGILTVLFNRQIMKYLDANALAIYGPIINISTFVQCCAYSVGQAAQPIISTNYGAGKKDRIKETLKYSIYSAFIIGIVWTALSESIPNSFIKLFMSPTDEILKQAPSIIRAYAVSFMLLPLNIFSTYYFQAIMKPKVSFVISVARGLVISGILILILPSLFAPNLIWWAMPITELIVAIYVVISIKRISKTL